MGVDPPEHQRKIITGIIIETVLLRIVVLNIQPYETNSMKQ